MLALALNLPLLVRSGYLQMLGRLLLQYLSPLWPFLILPVHLILPCHRLQLIAHSGYFQKLGRLLLQSWQLMSHCLILSAHLALPYRRLQLMKQDL